MRDGVGVAEAVNQRDAWKKNPAEKTEM